MEYQDSGKIFNGNRSNNATPGNEAKREIMLNANQSLGLITKC